MKRLATLTVAVFATILAILVLWQLRSIVLLFVLSLIVSALVRPPIGLLQKRGVPHKLAILLTYVVIFGGLAGLLYAVAVPVLDGLDQVVQDFAMLYRSLQTAEQSANSFWGVISTQMPTADQLDEMLDNTATFAMVQQLLGATQNFVASISQLLVATVLSIYWTADRVHFERLWLSLLPPEQRMRARGLWRRIEAAVGAYIGSKIVQTVAAGALLTAGYLALGVDYPYLLAFLAVLAWLVPLVGGWIAAIFAFLLSVGGGFVFAGIAVAFTVGILVVVWMLVDRPLYKHDRYGTVLVILILLIMVDALGFLGVLIAPLLAIAAQICLNEVMEPHEMAVPSQNGEVDLVELRQRLHRAQAMLSEENDPSPRMKNLVKRLDSLVQEVEMATYGREL